MLAVEDLCCLLEKLFADDFASAAVTSLCPFVAFSAFLDMLKRLRWSCVSSVSVLVPMHASLLSMPFTDFFEY